MYCFLLTLFSKLNKLIALGAKGIGHFGIFVLLILNNSVQAQLPNEGLQLLDKMRIAAATLEYTGEFVTVKNGEIQSLKIYRSPTKNGVWQKLQAMDGSRREIIQNDNIIACVLPDQGIGVREQKKRDMMFNINVTADVEQILNHYTVEKLQSKRVANQDCEEVSVRSKDEYRYGYELCIGTKHHLLLSSQLIDDQQNILESYLFTQIEYGSIHSSVFDSNTPKDELQWMDEADSNLNHSSLMPPDVVWKVIANESDFELEQTIHRFSPVLKANITHLVLSDGLARVSVFITPEDKSTNLQRLGTKNGSLNSAAKEVANYLITAVGEVPQKTVTLLVQNIVQ